jgi:hypothetical protein
MGIIGNGMGWVDTGNGSGTDYPFALFVGISRSRESALGTSTARSKTIYMGICKLDMHHSIYFVFFWRVRPENKDGRREGQPKKGGYVCTDKPTARDWPEGFPFCFPYGYHDRFGSFTLFSSKQLCIAFERLVFCISVILSVISESSSPANLAFYLCLTTFHYFYEEQIPPSAQFTLFLTHRTYTAKRFSRTKIFDELMTTRKRERQMGRSGTRVE